MFGTLAKEFTPLPVDETQPEHDDSPLLGLNNHPKFKMVLVILQWTVTVGKPELSATVASLNRFGSCPRERHLQLAIRVFGYVKTVTHKQIDIDSRPMNFSREAPNFKKLPPDFLQITQMLPRK